MSLQTTNSDFWAITSYFNPCGYQRRLTNYWTFRKSLEVPLVAVELSFGHSFELTPADADILIQLTDGDILWQKERLLDVGLRNLPNECDFVAWLDCDIVFELHEWPDWVRRELRKVSLVQLFRECGHLAPNSRDFRSNRTALTRIDEAVGWRIATGKPIADHPGDLTGLRRGDTIGVAWAASRDLMQKHAFYDASIVGGGDRAILSAAMRDLDRCIINQHMNTQRVEHYRSWGEPFSAQVRGKVGSIDGRVLHLWHGDLENRRYRLRNSEFARFEFDPFRDITQGRGGAWRWSSPKSQMHQFVCDYFFSRNEDGPANGTSTNLNFTASAPK
jgi:hypothetical protein